MRHAAVLLALQLCGIGTALVLDELASGSDTPGVVLVFSWQAAGALRAVDSVPSVSIVNSWANGRVVQLHAASTRSAAPPARDAVMWLRLPEPGLALTGCG